MDIEVEQQIVCLVQQWDTVVRPVSADEARSRPSGIGELDIDSTITPVQPLAEATPSRWWIWMTAAASIVALIVAVTALVREPSNGSISPAQPTATTSVAVETTVATTAVSDETVPLAEATPSVSAVTAQVIAQLSLLQSFSATATVHTTKRSLDDPAAALAPDSTTVNNLTLMADGSLWIQGDLALWSSYDASTGVSRGEFVGQDGQVQYQEIVGWADNSTPLFIALGYDPVMHVDAIQDTAVEIVESQLGRPAWRLTVSFTYGTPAVTAALSQVESYTIDQESGLIVEYARTSINNGMEDKMEATISNLELNVELPAEFPGVFPDGAVVDRSGNPDGFALLTPGAAAERFGGELLLPARGDSQQRIVLSSSDGLWGDPGVPVTNIQVEVELRTGFVANSVVVSKAVLKPGTSISDPTAAVVDGALCRSSDGMTCSDTADSVITSGALGGQPSTAEGSAVTATRGPVHYVVQAASAEDALAIANSFS